MTDSRYKYLYQINDDFPMYEPVTKFNARVDNAERLPDLMRQAFRVATTGTPGPVHLEIPGRLAEGCTGFVHDPLLADICLYAQVPAHRPDPEPGSISAACRILSNAERPVIISGGGVALSGAHDELVLLAEKLVAPVATTPNGKETIPAAHPLAVGMTGSYGRSCANRLVLEADVVVMVGTRAGGITTGNWHVPAVGSTVIQIDINPEEIGRNYPVEVAIVGDARKALVALVNELNEKERDNRWVLHAQSLVREWMDATNQSLSSSSIPIHPARICRELSKAMPDDTVVLSDTGHAAVWSGTLLDLKPGQRYIRCAGTLGWAFPATIGAQCALPKNTVVCFTGDGGFYYHLAELETAIRFGLNPVVVVNNNGALQQVRRGIDAAYGGTQFGRSHEMWVFRKETSLARLAEEFGWLGMRVTDPEDLAGCLSQAFDSDRPALVEVITDLDAHPATG